MIEKVDLIIESLKEREEKYKELQRQCSKVIGSIETLKVEKLRHDPMTSLLNIHNLWVDKKYQINSALRDLGDIIIAKPNWTDARGIQRANLDSSYRGRSNRVHPPTLVKKL